MPRVLACTTCAEDWKQFLAQPEKHWRPGFSAHSLAYRWEAADGLPLEVAAILETAPDGAAAGPKPFIGIPEYRVDLPGGERASQSDLMVVGRARDGAFTMTVEGKVDEPFDRTLDDWMRDLTPGKQERWSFLCRTLGLVEGQDGALRYQLFHRTASAVLTARQHHAPLAVMLVHSFSTKRSGFGDFAAFCAAFGAEAELGRLSLLAVRDEMRHTQGGPQPPLTRRTRAVAQ